MDKIIDGVDVSGCEFIGDIKNNFVKCTSWVHNSKKQVSGHWDCRENKACYYKELKRLQAKYDDLHLTYAGCKTANTGLQELNNELKKENMHYKHLIAKIRTIAKTGIEGFCPECSLRYCEENNCYETAIIDIYDLLKKENED